MKFKTISSSLEIISSVVFIFINARIIGSVGWQDAYHAFIDFRGHPFCAGLSSFNHSQMSMKSAMGMTVR